ncbi:hypothetical protein EXE58_05675 [Nocardioides seonyuensis]|uniref:FlgD Ig-like domain-containing protein n=1 Tax=Nocardioides seonyuensis TaxID=2518371 RepID=A0A4P7IEK6_9ACTN|nr:hypothetical protein [Nocardioides seonyuensis]QBX54993.1 hypothetical protein EXE58_05675 [Nocardioides seonyuensis]
MMRRLAAPACALLVAVAAAVLAPVPLLPLAGAQPATDSILHVTPRFSPNADGRLDQAVLRYRLVDPASVRITVSEGRSTHRIVLLGRQQAGEHVWRWNGKGRDGKVPSYCGCTITLRTAHRGSSSADTVDSVETVLDTLVFAEVSPRTDYGLLEGKALPVYPRSTDVRDSVALRPILDEPFRWATLLIKGPDGRTVLRRDVTGSEGSTAFGEHGKPQPDDVVWTARRHGKPLAPGRYRAFIKARDMAGNIGRSPAYRLWVSRDALEMVERVHVVSPQESLTSECVFSTANGCGEVPLRCGEVVPSALYPGGLSYRSRGCSTDAWSNGAHGLHYLPLPHTAGVRGVHSAKVSFTGRPTEDAAADQGTITLPREQRHAPGVSATSPTGAETPWVTCSRMCLGLEQWDRDILGEALVPGVVWSFATSGTDSFDVERFTVTVRHLVPAS